ncbi:clathrin interactor EPSIN 2 isoform X2 [Prunus yedoensis var. nudiflora]|uniref:Clathrin interactor EPSIN 2 isoform X2 n=1 Tax=Prunus yedoensis var. nudiflora TaxID=2094558 RepID=A0A314XG89_PRUYE|nr:clathrin interactor EPSIN 2 isoform X2 [Prunus yedoensis var. nudiflora]
MQSFDDPFGDSPFRALPSSETVQPQPQTSTPTDSFPPTMNQGAANFPFGDSFSAVTYSAPGVSSVQTPPTNSQFLPQEQSAEHNTPPFSGPTGQPSQPSANMYGNFHAQPGAIVPLIKLDLLATTAVGGFPHREDLQLPSLHMWLPKLRQDQLRSLTVGISFHNKVDFPLPIAETTSHNREVLQLPSPHTWLLKLILDQLHSLMVGTFIHNRVLWPSSFTGCSSSSNRTRFAAQQ